MAFALVAVAAGVPVGVTWLLLPLRQRCLLPLPRLRNGRWSGGEVMLCFFVLFFAAQISLLVLTSLSFFERIYETTPSDSRKLLWSSLLATPLTPALIFYCLFAASSTRPKDIGMTAARWRQNVVVGYLTWFVLTPLVWTLFAVCLLFAVPEEHPLSMLAHADLSAIEWILFVFQAGVYAPVTEELFFRGVLMGWLRRASFAGHCTIAVLALAAAALSTLDVPAQNSGALAEVKSKCMAPKAKIARQPPAATIKARGARPPVAGTRENTASFPAVRAKGEERLTWSLNFGLAIFLTLIVPPYLWQAHRALASAHHEHGAAHAAVVGSALLFAAIHSTWPSQIPLFVLGLGLGWLAYRTQSLLGPMVVHGLFNLMPCLQLILGSDATM